MLEAGMKAPEFALPDQNGKVHTWKNTREESDLIFLSERQHSGMYQNRHVVSENYILNFQKKSGCAWSKQG